MHQSVTARSNRVRRALSYRHARQHVPPGHVVWVYAITGSLAPDQLDGLTGVAGERVRAVSEAGLTAVVGSVDAQTFGDHARAGLMSDLASIERLARAHHQVIACVAADGPVLPLRLGTIYPDDHTVRTLLARSSAQFAMILDSFRGTEEWGVKVYAGKEAAASPQAGQASSQAGQASPQASQASPQAGQVSAQAGQVSPRAGQVAPRAADEGMADETAGSLDALSSPGDQVTSDGEPEAPDAGLIEPMPAAEDAEAFAEMVDRALAGIAIASRHYAPQDPRIDSTGKSLVLNAAYLVLSDRAGEFTAVARALTRAQRGMGAGLTGPWPPYSFADVGPV
jgi:Gas vesicle synthesis protein GvpL/GvpF